MKTFGLTVRLLRTKDGAIRYQIRTGCRTAGPTVVAGVAKTPETIAKRLGDALKVLMPRE